jgi:hypothetical protein
VGRGAGLGAIQKRKIPLPIGNRTPGRPTHSQSRYSAVKRTSLEQRNSHRNRRQNRRTYQADGLARRFRTWKLSRISAVLTSLGVHEKNLLIHFRFKFISFVRCCRRGPKKADSTIN